MDNIASISAPAPFTVEVRALRRLNLGSGCIFVNWAEMMVLSGFESPSLYVLLGESAPHNSFEIYELFDKVAAELSIPTVSSDIEAVIHLASTIAQKYMEKSTSLQEALESLAQLPWGMRHFPRNNDLHLDIVAYTDQNGLSAEQQDAVAEKLLLEYHRAHPLTDWQPFEWRRV